MDNSAMDRKSAPHCLSRNIPTDTRAKVGGNVFFSSIRRPAPFFRVSDGSAWKSPAQWTHWRDNRTRPCVGSNAARPRNAPDADLFHSSPLGQPAAHVGRAVLGQRLRGGVVVGVVADHAGV